jgi:hypothetical protein
VCIFYTYGIGSSDFPRSLCFMWFWFGLEILRPVYKKAFFKILNGFYVPYKNWNFFFKLGAKGIKRNGILRWFQKCVELLRQEVPKDFFSEKRFLALKNSVFLYKFFSPFAKHETSAHFWNQRKIALLLIPYFSNFKEFFFISYEGRWYFFSEDKRSNKIETIQYFKKRFFIN